MINLVFRYKGFVPYMQSWAVLKQDVLHNLRDKLHNSRIFK